MFPSLQVGYCGADLKALCTEASLAALRNKYPQIYETKDKLLLDVSSLQIKIVHFKQAMTKVVPAGQRSVKAVGRKLSPVVRPLLSASLDAAVEILRKSFPHGFAAVRIIWKRSRSLCFDLYPL